jgi:hypothetical protein
MARCGRHDDSNAISSDEDVSSGPPVGEFAIALIVWDPGGNQQVRLEWCKPDRDGTARELPVLPEHESGGV